MLKKKWNGEKQKCKKIFEINCIIRLILYFILCSSYKYINSLVYYSHFTDEKYAQQIAQGLILGSRARIPTQIHATLSSGSFNYT